jgi:hypothetical protein
LVLLTLLDFEQQHKEFEGVTSAFQSRFLPPTSSPAGLKRLADVKEAMRDIYENLPRPALESDDHDDFVQRVKPMTWARQCLTGVGIDETNPVDLLGFALFWADSHLTIREML